MAHAPKSERHWEEGPSRPSTSQALGFAGLREEALEVLEGLERRRSYEYVGSFFLSLVCVGL